MGGLQRGLIGAAGLGLAALAGLLAGTLSAAPAGCGAAAWPLEPARALMAVPDLPVLSSGARLELPAPGAVELTLAEGTGGLPRPPERPAPAGGLHAGYLELDVPAPGGLWQITLSDEAWVDVIMNGAFRAPIAFTGVRDCPGVRKSLRFSLAFGRAILQVSAARAGRLRLVVAPQD